MNTKTIGLASVVLAGLAMVASTPGTCLAGRPTTSSGYSTSGYRPASPVYGFGPKGQSFTYQPSGSATYSGTSRSPSGSSIYGPQYRLDSFTRPQTATSVRTPIETQQYYFSGRMWYPRK